MKKLFGSALGGLGIVLTAIGLVLMAYTAVAVVLVWGDDALDQFLGMCLGIITIGGGFASLYMLRPRRSVWWTITGFAESMINRPYVRLWERWNPFWIKAHNKTWTRAYYGVWEKPPYYGKGGMYG